MAKKKYISRTGIQYTFPVKTKNGKVVWISFKGNESDYVTSSKDVQEAIEATDKYKDKIIELSDKQDAAETEEDSETENTGAETIVYDEVTDHQTAREILMKDFGLKPQAIANNPQVIEQKAAELGVSFPNLKVL